MIKSTKMEILDIKKFANDENAWYLLMLPAGIDSESMISIKDIFEESKVKGKFIMVTDGFDVTDISYIADRIRKEIEIELKL